MNKKTREWKKILLELDRLVKIADELEKGKISCSFARMLGVIYQKVENKGCHGKKHTIISFNEGLDKARKFENIIPSEYYSSKHRLK